MLAEAIRLLEQANNYSIRLQMGEDWCVSVDAILAAHSAGAQAYPTIDHWLTELAGEREIGHVIQEMTHMEVARQAWAAARAMTDSAGAQEPVAVVRDYPATLGTIIEATSSLPVGTKLFAHSQPMTQTDAARDALAKAVARYDELTGSIQGCTDGGCLIRKPEGMHTNGGCRCARDHMKMQRAMYAANELRNALAEIERLDRAKGE